MRNLSLIYSPLFIDVLDTENQGIFDEMFPFDEVSGYSISLIDKNLTTLKCYDDVERFLLKNEPSYITNSQIYTLLKLYKEKWEEK